MKYIPSLALFAFGYLVLRVVPDLDIPDIVESVLSIAGGMLIFWAGATSERRFIRDKGIL